MKGSWIYTHFNTGEISNEVRGRLDAKWYYSALQKAVNCFIFPFGNIKRRSGTKYIYHWDSVDDIYFLPFVYSEVENYVIGIKNVNGVLKANFYTREGIVIDSSTGQPYEIDIPWSTPIDLFQIQYCQKDDIVYICHPEQPVIKLIRYGETNWVASVVNFNVSCIVDYGDGVATIAQTILPNIFCEPTKVQVTFKATDINDNVNEYVFTDDGSGNFSGSPLKVGKIDYVTGKIYLSLDTSVVKAFTEGEPIIVKFLNMSNIKTNAISFFENRLILGGIKTDDLRGVQLLMGSVIGKYEDFIFETKPQFSWVFEIASERNDEIQWLLNKDHLIVGTRGGEYIVLGGEFGITASSVTITKQSEYNTTNIKPVIVENVPVFVNQSRNRLYGFMYDYASNSYKGNDLNILNSDITKPKIKQLAFSHEPFTSLWCLLEDGSIAILLFMANQGLMGWVRFYSGNEDYFDKVLSIAGIPSNDGSFTQIYLAVKRFDKVYIECLTNPFYEDYFDAMYVDCGVEYDNPNYPTNTIYVPYPDGTEVQVLTDKGLHHNVVVTNGQVVLDWESSHIVVGLPYITEFWLLPFEIYSQGRFCSFGKTKSISNVCVYLYKSLGGQIGINQDYTFIYRTPEDLMDFRVPLYTGIKRVNIYESPITGYELFLGFKHELPLPFNVLSVSMDFMVGDL